MAVIDCSSQYEMSGRSSGLLASAGDRYSGTNGMTRLPDEFEIVGLSQAKVVAGRPSSASGP